ncbi:TlpA family protein disulfide reductase [Flavicella sediminum]|uniref:TlpA family protein disulfide reductase n=1 Tax=Flavicella sediminum TaxID=2585141 RepID=UPI001121CF99|nr:thioredoxin-like domain-containing protein [Flavicella sediminum]
MKLPLLIFSFLFAAVCHGQATATKALKSTNADINNSIAVYSFEELEPLLTSDSNKTFLINFWAMWCAPCVKELPILQAYEKEHPNVEVLLVSLDFPEDIETKLKPFLKKKGITSKVIVLDAPNANSWIDKIDPNWSGAIPFTIVFNAKNRAYYERAFEDVEDLKNEIKKTIKNK